MTRPHLAFVDNADSGVLNDLKDLWHKMRSPQTYDCQWCAVTYGPLGMRRERRAFWQRLEADITFLHRDEVQARHGVGSLVLPAVFEERDAAAFSPGCQPNSCGRRPVW
ncbi:hypothetical protein [Deinococcus arboris]|uniref:hypothetical protein n=1 Tax=Deinococcus arboris TaxID=2682977 RepID=UPI001E6400AC|nr:hypothetical protein [Deinococcus arboris]